MKVFIMDVYVYLNQCTRSQKNFSCNLNLYSILLFTKYININHLILQFPTWNVFWGSNCLTLWRNDCEWDRLKWHIQGYREKEEPFPESLYPMECWPRDSKQFHDTQWVKLKNDTPLFTTFSWKYISLRNMSSVTWVTLYRNM